MYMGEHCSIASNGMLKSSSNFHKQFHSLIKAVCRSVGLPLDMFMFRLGPISHWPDKSVTWHCPAESAKCNGIVVFVVCESQLPASSVRARAQQETQNIIEPSPTGQTNKHTHSQIEFYGIRCFRLLTVQL